MRLHAQFRGRHAGRLLDPEGYDIAAWAQANASRLGIMYIIYRQRIWDIRMASSGWVPMEDRGSITANHYDHVHISVF